MFSKIQFQQEYPGQLLIKIVPSSVYSLTEIYQYVINNIEQNLKGLVNFEVNFVDDIPRTSSGKQRLIVQNIKEV